MLCNRPWLEHETVDFVYIIPTTFPANTRNQKKQHVQPIRNKEKGKKDSNWSENERNFFEEQNMEIRR